MEDRILFSALNATYFRYISNYRHPYYFGDDPRPHRWRGYDADDQTDEACRYVREAGEGEPFALFLSWGPPHNPYETAPAAYRGMYDPATIQLPANVPEEKAAQARRELAGYYAHCSALDACFGRLLETLAATGRDRDTIVIFTSDHGDMLGSQGMFRKQKPWAESLRVPFLVRHPLVKQAHTDSTPVDAPDLMPTLLALCGLPIPGAVQGADFSAAITEGRDVGIDSALLALYSPFHEWRYDNGGREYRGLHTRRYTYVRALGGPWLLYDNQADPAQLTNRVDDPELAGLVHDFDVALTARLKAVGDDFSPGPEIVQREGYALSGNGEIAIMPSELPDPY